MNNVLQGQLSNVQIELMKLFATDVPDEELENLKKILLEFKFERATKLADKVWEEKGWTEADMYRLLKTHERTPYKAQEEFKKKQSSKS